MWLNILIAASISVLTYGATIYFDQRPPPREIIVAPDTKLNTVTLEPGKATPDFSFETLNGKAHKISDFKGKIVILNFWATWCAPCLVEFPALLDVAAAHEEDVVLLALSSDLGPEKITPFLNKMEKQRGKKIPDNVFIAIDDMGKVTQEIFQTYRLPETIIIDREQNLRSKLIGANWEPEDLNKIIKELQ